MAMKSFFKKILSSIWGPQFYLESKNESFWKSIRFVLFLIVLISIVGSIVLFITVSPLSKKVIFDLADYLHNEYPSELEIYVKDGVLSSSPNGVHNLRFPEDVFGKEVIDQIKKDSKVNYLFSVDDREENRKLPAYNEINSLIFANKDYLVMKEGHSGKVTSYELSKMNDFIVNRSIVDGYIESIKKWFWPFMVLVASIFTVMFTLSMFVKYILVALLAAFIVWVILVFAKKDEEYDVCFKKAMYATTLPIILGFLFFLVGGFIGMNFISAVLLSSLIVLANREG